MRTGKKGRISAAVLLAIIFGVGSLPANASRPHAQVTVTVWTAYTKGLLDAFNALTTQFEKAYPNISIQEVSSVSYTALQQKEESAILANNTPTIAQAYESWVQQYEQSGAVQNLAPYINNKKSGLSKKDIADFFVGDWRDGLLGKSRVMMPFSKSDIVLYFDGPMLRRAGIKSPPSTWTQFAADCAKLTKGPAGHPTQWCTTLQAPESEWFAWEQEWGNKILDKSNHAAFNSKAGAAPIAFFQNLVKKGEMVISQTANYQDEADFDAGKTAFDIGTSAGLTYEIAGAKPGVAVGEAEFPAGPKGRVTELYGAPLMMFKNASPAEKQAAWTFMKWLTEPKQTAYWAEHTGYMPVRRSALPLMKSYYVHNPQQRASVQEQDVAKVEPTLAGWSKASNDVNSILLQALTNQFSALDAVRKAASQVNTDLASS
jgi:ABC-type glycerol-3-phosphate transport system substrate-binding protein